MTDISDELRGEKAEALRNFVADVVREHLVADAPPDQDEVMQTIPVYSGRVRILLVGAALLALWMLIIGVSIYIFR